MYFFTKKFFLTCSIFLIMVTSAAQSFAMVRGACSACHTMHNSQDDAEIMSGGALDHLVVDSCVGCHSSSSSQTISSIASSDLPIVLNSSLPSGPLAGGNFYWMVSQSDHSLGHNVEGIAVKDSNIDYVPGKSIGIDSTLTITNCYNCHKNGFDPGTPGIPMTIERSGDVLICRDCHNQPKHHADDSGTLVDGSGGWYRFIYGVKGIEDTDWQKTVSESDHNEYQGEIAALGGSISDTGCACHSNFHALRNPDDVGTDSPWFNHPVDIALPEEGEYSAYSTYDPDAPVARPDLAGYSGPSSTVTSGTDQVMCLSCHRAHGSPYSDMLRWDYKNDCKSNVAEEDCGCFKCHADKDGT